MRSRNHFVTISTLMVASHLGCGGKTETDATPPGASGTGGYANGSSVGGSGSGLIGLTGGASMVAFGGNAGVGANTASGGLGISVTSATGGGPDLATYCNGIFAGGCLTPDLDVNAVNMLLVLDESGSMNDSASITDVTSKWTVLKSAIAAELAPFQSRVGFGLEPFPYLPVRREDQFSNDPNVMCAEPQDASAIAIPVVNSADSVKRITDFMDGQSPAGGRPMASALQQAYAYFTTGAGSTLPGSRYVLLVTNGGPNCNMNLACSLGSCTQNIDGKCGNGPGTTVNCCDGYGYVCLDDAAAVDAVNVLAKIGVWTFVVGLPGSEPYADTLQRLAVAGRPPYLPDTTATSYYAVSGENILQDLRSSLSTMMSIFAKPCDIPLPFVPSNPERLNVAVDCTVVQMIPAGASGDAGVDGFYIDYLNNSATLHLVGSSCSPQVRAGTAHVDVVNVHGCIF